MAIITNKTCLCVIILCAIFIPVFLTASFLQGPLFEAGTSWIKSADNKIYRLVTWMIYLPDFTSFWTYFKIATFVAFVYCYYVVQIRPLNRVRKLEDVGYLTDGAYSAKETANFVQKQRKAGRTPPPYPNGWFGLIESIYLKKCETKTISALGQNFAVFRDADGTVHILDAYCPHLGANLAVGGRVIGDCIECPFHAWRFRGEDGKCVYIPYTDKIPEVARIKTWPVREVSGWIFVWYHAEGLTPSWAVPEVEELEKKRWVYRGRTEHYISAHIEEISENGADVVHLKQVHTPIMVAGNNLRTMWSKLWAFACHQWTAAWEQGPDPDGHVGFLKLTHEISFLGFHLPMFGVAVSARQIGPGLVYLEFENVFGKGMFIQTVTPQGPLLQKVVHNIYASAWIPAVLAKIYMIGEAIQVERDIMIWNNKQYEGRPLFVRSKEDTLISKHRRWYSQFYSDKSPGMFQKEDLTF